MRKMGAVFAHNWLQTQPCERELAMFNRNPDKFLYSSITMYETWIHQNTLQMGTVFWDAGSMFHINYLQKEKTNPREYYANLL